MTGIVDFRTQILDENGVPIDEFNPFPTTGSGSSSGSSTDAYALNDFADGTPLYLGKSKEDGTWLFQRYDGQTGQMRYANASNNGGLDYSGAWASKESLNYVLFQDLTGV